MEIKNRQQLLIIFAIAAAVIFAGDKIIFEPLVTAWKSRTERIAELRKQVAQGHSLLDRERTIRDRWEQMRRNTLPSSISIAEQNFFKAIDEWAQDSRVSVKALTPQRKHDSEDYMTIQCRVDVEGNLGTIGRFIYDIEKDPMALKVESLELGSRDKEGQQLAMALQVSGLVLNPRKDEETK